MPRETCVVKMAEIMNKYTGADPERIKLFCLGFWTGACEKVRKNPPAAMFRPSLKQHPWALEGIRDVAQAFGLVTILVSYREESLFPCFTLVLNDSVVAKRSIQEFINENGRHQELWVSRPGNVARIEALKSLPVNSPEWHRERGLLCGIPEDEIDPEFHLREGYGKFAHNYYPEEKQV
ncbi:MAG: hypothetical protein A2719_05230 [Candidatus Ryanbacteria bacterium RIFCSPHIGHO2_01_FULL_45_22]|uniref:Uncharacterized protein n=1 Tax=Candidatus Ryanbacteria bacterium RIFCSPHIGHO2_01_FULL_45_22 TaxID=1802114 RepID=A0A1G2G2H9_9BACT|nr:MAG: hypothetical protein A2719_05230 [Candidatus Ryanbacteria bacterium RIFCSPHIGHO2_01_FULL_45_22]